MLRKMTIQYIYSQAKIARGGDSGGLSNGCILRNGLAGIQGKGSPQQSEVVMKLIVWIKDPSIATGLMSNLVFQQGHTVTGVSTLDDVTALLSDSVGAVLVDSEARREAVIKAGFSGEVKLVAITLPPGEPKNKLDRSIYRIGQRIGQWLGQYGITSMPYALTAVILRCWLTIKLKVFKKPTMYVKLYTGRTGHLAYNTATFITAMKRRGISPKRIFPIVDSQGSADDYLLELWYRLLNKPRRSWMCKVVTLPIFRRSGFYADSWQYTDALCPIQTIGGKYDVELLPYVDEAHHAFMVLEERIHSGFALCEYIVFHARDNSYLQKQNPNVDWSYHDFRDCDIETYLLAAHDMVEHGLKAVRIGIETTKAIKESHGIYDYAKNPRDEVADLLLIKGAKFLLGSNCGVTQVAQILSVPVAIANWAQLELLTTFVEGDLMIPKPVFSIELERNLKLSEILESGVGRFTRMEEFAEKNLALVDNTDVEIDELCFEMNQRLDGRWIGGEQDDERQAKFKAIINQPQFLCNGSPVKVGAGYLMENEWMMQ